MNFQLLSGKKFFVFVVIVVFSFTIISLKIIDSTLTADSSANKELSTFKNRIIVQLDHELSNTTSIRPISYRESAKKSTAIQTVFSVLQLQRVKSDNTNASDQAHIQMNGGLGNGCKIPPRGFKSWTRGTVTKVTPVIHANCTLLFKGGDELEVAQVQLASYTWPAKEHELKFAKWVKTHTCKHFMDELEDNVYTTKDEIDFPLAFTMVVHNNASQVFRLLKVLYRPHNIYCIHYDSRSSADMKLLFKKLTKCFDNIITPSSISEVEWGHHSLMDAQMNCLRKLLRSSDKYPWHYVITLCGKELPLRTNGEIVQLLKRFKGNSAIHAFPIPRSDRMRYKIKWTLDKNMSKLVPTKEDAGPIPYNLTIYKSMIYFALTPEFVNYTLNDEVAIALSKFLKDALIPEESFYSTLFMIPGR